ncbi:hypothetical protein BaRGS_00029290 [Batillaria attramentaria]|uniref:Uncharacterized protein n=1 Tax=Batillaria attramentaria TaxID=370345 RepID=A0ABD0JXL7_9CAEN
MQVVNLTVYGISYFMVIGSVTVLLEWCQVWMLVSVMLNGTSFSDNMHEGRGKLLIATDTLQPVVTFVLNHNFSALPRQVSGQRQLECTAAPEHNCTTAGETL